MIRMALTAAMLLAASTAAQAADPRTCSEAYTECASQRQCDSGCLATCRIRLDGCLKTGAFAAPGKVRQNLKRN
jgi:hypothetical protein